jgi:hypothetical protein
MNLRNISRVLAVGSLLASTPVALLKYPWLPATVMEFVQLRREPPSYATESYRQDRARLIRSTRVALLLYALGTASLWGLCFLAVGRLRWWTEIGTWMLVGLTGIWIADFESPSIGPTTDRFYVGVMIGIPHAIAVASGAAALFRLTLHFILRPASEESRAELQGRA